jgi:hypothetical protein
VAKTTKINPIVLQILATELMITLFLLILASGKAKPIQHSIITSLRRAITILNVVDIPFMASIPQSMQVNVVKLNAYSIRLNSRISLFDFHIPITI